MNETDWLGATDPAAMLDYLDGKASDRKLRLFAVACVRRWQADLKNYQLARSAVDLAERYAEGQATDAEMEELRQQGEMYMYDAGMFEQLACAGAFATLAEMAIEAARTARESVRVQAVRDAAYSAAPWENEASINAEASAVECLAQGRLVLEIFGNPFRPVTIDPTWLQVTNGAAGAIAQLIDEEGRYQELPYLADALMDAGCNEEVLLRHLRSPDGHVRGCWALDALLGKE